MLNNIMYLTKIKQFQDVIFKDFLRLNIHKTLKRILYDISLPV